MGQLFALATPPPPASWAPPPLSGHGVEESGGDGEDGVAPELCAAAMLRPRQRRRCASGRHGAAAATAAMALLSLPPLLLAMLLHAAEAARLVSSADDGVVASYRSYNESVNFTHLVLDRAGGRLYLGATNRLYQLDAARLQLQVDLATGPVQDSVQCSPASCDGYPTVPTNNVNKVLLIDPVAQKLIVCGSARQGACQRHSLSDVAEKEPLVPTPVAANDENSSTFALIAPSHYYGRDSRALYVATTNSRQGPYRDMVPAICTRSLEPESERFRIIEQSFSETARIDMAHHIKDYYLVRYVYGFHTDEYVYFATVQRKSHLRASEELGYISRLARVCTSDPGYNTYTEVTLQCVGADGTDYNLLQDAVVFDAGDDLSRELRLPLGGGGGRRRRVLAAVFALSRDHTARSARRSALCLYPLRDVERRFTENIHMCYNGSVLTRNMDYIAGSVQSCPEPGQSGNVLSFCNETLKLNGSSPISRAASAVFENLTLTFVQHGTPCASTSVYERIRGYSSPLDGQASRECTYSMFLTSQGRAEQFEEVTIDDGNPILPDMEVDKTGHFLYVASPYKSERRQASRWSPFLPSSVCPALDIAGWALVADSSMALDSDGVFPASVACHTAAVVRMRRVTHTMLECRRVPNTSTRCLAFVWETGRPPSSAAEGIVLARIQRVTLKSRLLSLGVGLAPFARESTSCIQPLETFSSRQVSCEPECIAQTDVSVEGEEGRPCSTNFTPSYIPRHLSPIDSHCTLSQQNIRMQTTVRRRRRWSRDEPRRTAPSNEVTQPAGLSFKMTMCLTRPACSVRTHYAARGFGEKRNKRDGVSGVTDWAGSLGPRMAVCVCARVIQLSPPPPALPEERRTPAGWVDAVAWPRSRCAAALRLSSVSSTCPAFVGRLSCTRCVLRPEQRVPSCRVLLPPPPCSLGGLRSFPELRSRS
ncbi:hypothetical protein HPB50_013957 [Hyalomma asiaticum]|uniref:Uncharacterized protein n=1 Tax=Hyalomma asiaticum TaxID=266040 RepID=A0ACB7S3I5_HYAAI|nr:hypothetical protein HPB50_013957 [Hyalomma asiaticum]